jgi:uncharacterized protein YcnI
MMLVPSLGRLARPSLAATLMVALVGAPAAAVADIPEEEVISTPGRQLIHVRIQRGCQDAAVEGVDAPVDRVEVQIPDGVFAVLPGAVGDWVAETEITETDEYEVFGQTQTERVSVVRWTGGPLPGDQFLDFPIYAVFTEEDPELAFPVIQGCGATEEQWVEEPGEDEDRDDLDFPAPVVAVVPPPTTDLPTLQGIVQETRGQVDDLREELEQVRAELGDLPDEVAEPVPDEDLEPVRQRIRNLRQRINDLEAGLEALEAGQPDEGQGNGGQGDDAEG